MSKDKSDEIYEVVAFIKDRMATKDDLAELRTELKGDIVGVKDEITEVKTHLTAVEGKVNGIYNLFDTEVDRRKMLEVRTTKLEQKVFGKS